MNVESIFKALKRPARKQGDSQKQQESADPYTNTDTLLGYIEKGNQDDFKSAPKCTITNEDRIKLAEEIVLRYRAADDVESSVTVQKVALQNGNGNVQGAPGGLQTPPPSVDGNDNVHQPLLLISVQQTQEQWLKLLLEACPPDQKAQRNMAEELIKKMGHAEMRQQPLEKKFQAQYQGHADILTYLIMNTRRLYYETDGRDQTVFHIAAINGARNAIEICLWGIDCSTSRPCESNSHVPGCKGIEETARLLTSVDQEGYSPLSYAVTKNKLSAAGAILNLLGNTSEEEIRQLLRAAITSSNGNNVEIMRSLLADRSKSGKGAMTYRAEIVDHNILRLAAKHFNSEVFDFLISKGTNVLGSSDCDLMHYVVHIGQVAAAKCLLKKFPDLATKLLVHPDHVPTEGFGSSAMEVHRLSVSANGRPSSAGKEEERVSVLALFKGEDAELRDLIFETLMGRLRISELREHLQGTTWTGKEISLDVTILAVDVLSLQAFFSFVCSDMEKLEKCLRFHGADDGELDLLLQTNRLGLFPLDKLSQCIADHERQGETVDPLLMADHLKHLADEMDDTNVPVNKLPCIDSGGVEFERILKYVNIPSFAGQLAEKRIEAVKILQWLKICKGVKRVFEVTVDDCRYRPSTEEDIEMALRDLGVQYLDWRRTDLSITSISGVAKDLKTLHLYSSGSLAAIDHWLGPKGVAILDLDWLYIHVIQDNLVSKSRAQLCKRLLDDAKLKAKNTPLVTIETTWIPEPAGRHHHGSSGSTKKQSPVEVTGLSHFMQWYADAWDDQEESLAAECHQMRVPLEQAIIRTKVAILDSGVNGTRFPLRSHERQGRSFVWRDTGKGYQSEASWWLAVDPHGSQMANIISQLDPFCKFYFFQIADNMNYIESPTVVKALEEAIKCGVDIINCSFALDSCSEDLDRVVRDATEKGIIIMCSTADEGENTDEVWPAAFYRREQDKAQKFENIFPIVGCDEHGKFSKYANEGAGRYMFRGEDVDVSSTDPMLPIETADVEGSSVATAIATGVASLILSCHRMVRDKIKKDSSRAGLVNACFSRMSEKLRKSNAPERVLVKASNFFPPGEEDFRDIDHFLDVMEILFDEVS